MQVPTNEVDPDNVGGSNSPLAGSYHVAVQDVNENDGSDKAMEVHYEILRGTTPNQEGKTFYDYFHKSDASAQRMTLLAYATGLTTPAKVKECKARGEPIDIDYTQAIGRKLCIKLEDETYEGKTRAKTKFNFWAVDHPDTKDIPKMSGGQQAAASTPEPAAAAAAGGNDGDQWGDL